MVYAGACTRNPSTEVQVGNNSTGDCSRKTIEANHPMTESIQRERKKSVVHHQLDNVQLNPRNEGLLVAVRVIDEMKLCDRMDLLRWYRVWVKYRKENSSGS